MCGIFAYTGGRAAQDILLDGLSTLEYRGYDSAGIAFGGTVTVDRPRNLAKSVAVE